MTPVQIDALNAAGEALKGLGMGTVRLRWREPDHLIPRPLFSLWIEGDETHGDFVGAGETPEAALLDAIALKEARHGTA